MLSLQFTYLENQGSVFWNHRGPTLHPPLKQDIFLQNNIEYTVVCKVYTQISRFTDRIQILAVTWIIFMWHAWQKIKPLASIYWIVIEFAF